MKSKLVLGLLVLAMWCVTPLGYSSAKNTQDVQIQFPPGKWTLQHPAVSRLGLAEAPLQITSVTGDINNGGTITALRIKNNSGKAVTAVKFAWYLFRSQEPKKILQRGESPVLEVTGFSNGSVKDIAHSIVSFGNIYKTLVKDGKLKGDFVLEVAVSDILYHDGSKWERE